MIKEKCSKCGCKDFNIIEKDAGGYHKLICKGCGNVDVLVGVNPDSFDIKVKK